jgi:hypothetical protein
MATPSLEILARIRPTMQPMKSEILKVTHPAQPGVYLVKNRVKMKKQAATKKTRVPIMQITGLKIGFPKRPTTKPSTINKAPKAYE